MNDLLVTKQSKRNDLQGQEQGLRNKAKGLSFKAKDLKIVLKDSLRPRTPIIESLSMVPLMKGSVLSCIWTLLYTVYIVTKLINWLGIHILLDF